MSDVEIARYRMMAELAKDGELDDWRAAGFVPGATVGDVGCGPAVMSVLLADLVGPDGHVHAVERDADALAQARQITADRPNLTVHEAVATAVPVDGLDALMMRHVLAHNGGTEQSIVDHLATRVRPGGWVYLLDVDLTCFRLVDVDPELVEMHQCYTEFHRSLGNDPQVGLRLGNLLRGAGLVDVVHRGHWNVMPMPPGLRPPAWAAREAMIAQGSATEADYEVWGAALGRADTAAVRPTMFIPGFAAWGRRPD